MLQNSAIRELKGLPCCKSKKIHVTIISFIVLCGCVFFQKCKWAKSQQTCFPKEQILSPLSFCRDQSGRILCGVMRIGLVAKGLLIKDDMDLELVLMCKEKPTETLLSLVKDNLPIQIQVSKNQDSLYLSLMAWARQRCSFSPFFGF